MQTQAQIREVITQKIVEALKKGVVPWRKPWSDVPDPVRLPTNVVTKRAYQGANIPILWLAQHEKGYPISFWASFNQWKSVGASVKKGERATQIILWKPVERRVRDNEGNEKVETFPILRTWSSFNISQCQGEVIEQFTKPNGVKFDGVDRSEFDQAVAATKADIRHGGNKAVYHRPPADFILVPNEEQFESFPAYAETVLHELAGHWTEHRLGWEGNYSEGEIRAEAAAAFSATALGIPNTNSLDQHAAYIQSWLKELENDPKFIFRSMAAASKATDYFLSFSRPKEENQSATEELAEAV